MQESNALPEVSQIQHYEAQHPKEAERIRKFLETPVPRFRGRIFGEKNMNIRSEETLEYVISLCNIDLSQGLIDDDIPVVLGPTYWDAPEIDFASKTRDDIYLKFAGLESIGFGEIDELIRNPEQMTLTKVAESKIQERRQEFEKLATPIKRTNKPSPINTFQ